MRERSDKIRQIEQAAVDNDGGLGERLLSAARQQLARGGLTASLDPAALLGDSTVQRALAELADRDGSRPGWRLATASSLLRSVLVELARERAVAIGADPTTRLTLAEPLTDTPRGEDAIAVDSALRELEALDPPLAELAQMHYFGGFDVAKIAEALHRSEESVQRDWRKARALLAAMIAS